MAYSDFEALKAFFGALRESGFGKNRLPNNIKVLGGVIPTNYCFDVFRKFFPDFREKKNEEIIKYFSKDPRNAERLLASRFRPEERAELEKTLVKKPAVTTMTEQAAVEQAPSAGPATGSSGGGMPGMPSAPSISSGPRISYNIPRAPEPSKPEIHIANAGGAVREAGDPSKLVRATSSGRIVEPPPKQIFIANKSGVVTGVRNIKSPGWLKTLGSNSQIFAKRNLGKVFDGFKKIAGGVGKGIAGPGLTGGARVLGKVGIGGINMGANLSNQASRLSIAGPGKKALIGGILVMVLGVAVIASAFPSQTSIPTTTNTGSSTSRTLDYKVPFRDPSVSIDAGRVNNIKDIIKLSWPNAKLDNWDTIVSQSIAAGWNPAFVLALWIEESGAQGAVDTGGNPKYSDPLGCAPHQPTDDINISLKCLFDNFSQYQTNQFQQFMERYSGGPTGNPFGNNPNFTFNLRSWYSTLIPTGSPGAIEIVTPPVGVLASCPITGGIIKTPSYQANPTTGHCSPSYGSCPAGSRRAKSIDVDTGGGDVLLPTIDGQGVDWYYLNQFSLNKPTDCEGGRSDCGIGVVFQARLESTMWTLHLLHLDPRTTLFNVAAPNKSGATAGKTVSGVYVHINIGKSIQNAQNPPQGDRDFDPGWLPADFMCQ